MDEEKPVWAEIAVMDQGVGIPKELVDRVFDPFFTTKAGGTGLGLAIVHRVIAEHRGVVRVERGARRASRTAIRLSLPRAEVRVVSARGARARRRRRAEHAGVPGDLPAQRGLRRGRRRRRGAARAQLENDDFDLVITDMQMPGGSGLDLLREVQARASGARRRS